RRFACRRNRNCCSAQLGSVPVPPLNWGFSAAPGWPNVKQIEVCLRHPSTKLTILVSQCAHLRLRRVVRQYLSQWLGQSYLATQSTRDLGDALGRATFATVAFHRSNRIRQ